MDQECPICLDTFRELKQYIMTNCKHKFCLTCFFKLIKQVPKLTDLKCPYCRNKAIAPFFKVALQNDIIFKKHIFNIQCIFKNNLRPFNFEFYIKKTSYKISLIVLVPNFSSDKIFDYIDFKNEYTSDNVRKSIIEFCKQHKIDEVCPVEERFFQKEFVRHCDKYFITENFKILREKPRLFFKKETNIPQLNLFRQALRWDEDEEYIETFSDFLIDDIDYKDYWEPITKNIVEYSIQRGSWFTDYFTYKPEMLKSQKTKKILYNNTKIQGNILHFMLYPFTP